MPEDVYGQFKKEQAVGAARPVRRTFRVPVGGVFGTTPGSAFVRGSFGVGRRARLMSEDAEGRQDYIDYKESLSSAVAEIKTEIRDQHEKTRGEVQCTRRDLMEAIRSSPAQAVKLMIEFASLFLIFSLAVRFTLGIELGNPVFALFMLCAFALYWAMAHLKQHSKRRKQEPRSE